MEDVLFLVIMSAVGLLCVWMGYQIWIKEKITLIHDYHYTKVKETDKKAYTSIMGKAMLVIGIGAILSGLLSLVVHTGASMTPFGLCFVLGMVMFLYAQRKYNHGIF